MRASTSASERIDGAKIGKVPWPTGGINLKYCKIDLQDNVFEGSKSDAVDLDFYTGTIAGNTFIGAGGDGLDLSGSDVIIRENLASRCADKGISVGERSRAQISDNRILDCNTGIAVKDLSEAVIRNSRLANLQVGIAVYVKKMTFGPARAELENAILEDVATSIVCQDSCAIDRR